MKPVFFPLVFTAALAFFYPSNSLTFHDAEDDVERLWERILSPTDDEMFEPEFIKPKYPELSRKQADFAVNPTYRSFYNPGLRKVEINARNKDKPEPKDGTEADENAVSEPEDSTPLSVSTIDGASLLPDKKAMLYGPNILPLRQTDDEIRSGDIYFITVVAVCSAVSVFAVVGAGFCYHRVQKNTRASEEVEYPAYGVTGPGKEVSPTFGDRKLAQSAQMYHYQHQKQQMIAFDRNNGSERDSTRRNIRTRTNSDGESDDGEEGDYTVYECPGLAPAGEMEVRNPLFQDDATTPKNGGVP